MISPHPTRRPFAGRLLLLGLGLSALALGGAAACSSTPVPTRGDLLLQGLERIEEAVRAEVSDPVDRQEALARLAELRASELDFLASVERSRTRLWELNARHDATREELLDELETLDVLRRGLRDELLGAHRALREAVPADEYAALLDHLRAGEEPWAEVR
jgi:hypothetical protein